MPDATLLPPSSTPLERTAAEACAAATALPVPLRDTWNAEACPHALLPWLAWAYGVEEWDGTWSDTQQRGAIAASIPVKRVKGTVGAVVDALRSIGTTVRLQEWFNQTPPAAPYTYRLLLDVDQVGFDQASLARLMQVVARAKNLRSHLDIVLPSVTTRTRLVTAAVANTGHELAIGYDAPRYADGDVAFDLMTDAAYHGEASTAGAIDDLHALLHTTMTPAYW